MRKTLFILGTIGAAFAGIAAAQANPAQDRIIMAYCTTHAGGTDCTVWQTNRAKWQDDDYHAFYQAHQADTEFQGAAARPAFGQWMNASGDASNDPNWVPGTHRNNVEGNMPEVIGDSPNHVADCKATFKSYDVATDSYMNTDGYRQKCKL